jgi:hypothetical protein
MKIQVVAALVAGALSLGLYGVASAQNVICPTMPAGDSSNACADTAFVNGGGIGAGVITSGNLAAGAAAANVGTLGGVLTGTLPNPGMAAGAAASNVGTLGGSLSGTLPNPSIAPGVITNSNLANMAAGTIKANCTTASAAPQDCTPISADKVAYVSTSGNDSNSGLSPLFPKLTINAAINAVQPNGHVIVGAGTYTQTAISGPVGMRPGVYLECIPGATITQANGANLSAIVDFSGFFAGSAATGATMRYCTIDGNQANNTNFLVGGSNIGNVYFGNTNNVTIDSNIIQNATGFGVIGSSQTGLVVSNNRITNTVGNSIFAVQIVTPVQGNCHIEGNFLDNSMLIEGINGCVITRNNITGTLIGGLGAAQTVSTSGTAVTWVSGPQFTNVVAGMVILAGGNQQFIKTVNSATSLTMTGTMPTQTGVASVEGTNDQIGLIGVQDTVVSNNVMKSGVSFGISIGDNGGSLPSANNLFAGNVMDSQGRFGFGSFLTGGTTMKNLTIVGNAAVNSSLDGAAACPATAGCAHGYFFFTSSGTYSNILLEGNSYRDDNGLSNTWLGQVGIASTALFVGPGNHQSGAANNGIFGGVGSIVLGAGWGTTATTSGITHNGNSIIFTINSSGTGQAASPVTNVNLIATKPSQGVPLWHCKWVAGTGVQQFIFGENNSVLGGPIFLYNGTPTAGQNYQIICE